MSIAKQSSGMSHSRSLLRNQCYGRVAKSGLLSVAEVCTVDHFAGNRSPTFGRSNTWQCMCACVCVCVWMWMCGYMNDEK